MLFRSILNYHNIKVIPITLPKIHDSNTCFHLMSLVSMLDHDLAIGCISLLSRDLIKIFSDNNIFSDLFCERVLNFNK